MDIPLFQGELVRLAAPDVETDAELLARWSRDSEYLRLLDTDPARPRSLKAAKEEIKEHLEQEQPKSDAFGFIIRTLAEDRPIGFIGLEDIQWTHGDAVLAVGLGEREYWGRGYGTDALRVMLRYAFTELNLHRVTLDVFEYNPRAIRSYEKVGFVVEGRLRRFLNRDGRRWDLIYMGILREEWEMRQQ